MLRFSFYRPVASRSSRACAGVCLGVLSIQAGGIFRKGGWMALTDVEIKRAKAKDKAYRMSDSGGMYLWVTPAGGKLWRWAYVHDRKEKLMSFGRYPDVSLATARERQSDARKLLASVIDPMAERKVEKIAEQVACESSFANVAGKWME